MKVSILSLNHFLWRVINYAAFNDQGADYWNQTLPGQTIQLLHRLVLFRLTFGAMVGLGSAAHDP
jgi:hypothetical protein